MQWVKNLENYLWFQKLWSLVSFLKQRQIGAGCDVGPKLFPRKSHHLSFLPIGFTLNTNHRCWMGSFTWRKWLYIQSETSIYWFMNWTALEHWSIQTFFAMFTSWLIIWMSWLEEVGCEEWAVGCQLAKLLQVGSSQAAAQIERFWSLHKSETPPLPLQAWMMGSLTRSVSSCQLFWLSANKSASIPAFHLGWVHSLLLSHPSKCCRVQTRWP